MAEIKFNTSQNTNRELITPRAVHSPAQATHMQFSYFSFREAQPTRTTTQPCLFPVHLPLCQPSLWKSWPGKNLVRVQCSREEAYSPSLPVKIPAVGPTAWKISNGPKDRVADDGVSQPSQCYFPADLKAKIVQGDYQALTSARKQNQADLQPNLSSIQNSTDKQSLGFVTVTDTASGQDYRLCASDSGWIWTYTLSITAKQSDGKLVNQCVVQTGTYSASAKWLGISYLTFENEATLLTAIAVAGFASLIVGNMVRNMVLGYIYERALASAVAAAEAGAVEGGFMTSETAALVWASLAGGLAGAIVGTVVGLVIYFISDFLHKSYGLTIQVYNWDTEEEWNITQWHADNAVVADGAKGSGPWKAVSLLPVQNSVPGPFGAIPAAQPVAQYAGYAFRNSKSTFDMDLEPKMSNCANRSRVPRRSRPRYERVLQHCE